MLNIGENDIRTVGAIQILKNGIDLKELSLAKNFIKGDAGEHIGFLLKISDSLQKLNLEFNELKCHGISGMIEGLSRSTSL